jgi:uncharacterized membrane protein
VHVPKVITTVLFVELFFEADDEVVVFDWIGYLKKFAWDHFVFKKIGDLRPVIIMLVFERLAGFTLIDLLTEWRENICLGYIC